MRIFVGRDREQAFAKFTCEIVASPSRGRGHAIAGLFERMPGHAGYFVNTRAMLARRADRVLNRRVTAFLAEPIKEIKDWLKVLVNSRLKSPCSGAHRQKWRLCGLKSTANGKSVDLASALVLSKREVNALHRPTSAQAEKVKFNTSDSGELNATRVHVNTEPGKMFEGN